MRKKIVKIMYPGNTTYVHANRNENLQYFVFEPLKTCMILGLCADTVFTTGNYL